jgi:ATP-dependent protease HslVU (ClpYQ) peptidase subunit
LTIIAAAEDLMGVWIGSDSKGVAGVVSLEFGSKIIKKNAYYVGFAQSYRIGDIIRECETFPKNIKSLKDLGKFRDTLQDLAIDKAGCACGGIEDTVIHPFNIIIAAQSGIYTIDSDYQIHKVSQYAAIGAGTEVALGALRTAIRITSNASRAVRLAVEAAIYHNVACGGDVHIEYIPRGLK